MEDQVIYKVYRLFGAGLSYYGSTHQTLYDRKATHRSQHKNKCVCCSSKIILDACEDWDLEIVEILPVGSTQIDALLREKWWIDNNECVNINSPIGKTGDEMKEYKRKWAENNRRKKGVAKKEKIKTADEKAYKREKAREYRANYTEEKHQEILAKKKEAYDNEKQKEYVNRPEVKERRLAEQSRKRALVKLFNNLPFAEEV